MGIKGWFKKLGRKIKHGFKKLGRKLKHGFKKIGRAFAKAGKFVFKKVIKPVFKEVKKVGAQIIDIGENLIQAGKGATKAFITIPGQIGGLFSNFLKLGPEILLVGAAVVAFVVLK